MRGKDRVLPSVEIDFAVKVQALAPPAEKATRASRSGRAGQHPKRGAATPTPSPNPELRAKRLAFACPSEFGPDCTRQGQAKTANRCLTRQLKLLAFPPVVASPGAAGFVRRGGCFDPPEVPRFVQKNTYLD
jgi:hypothetical protein